MDGDGDYGFSRHRHVSAQAVGREDFGELSRAAPATSETPRTPGSPTSRSTRSTDAAEGMRYRVAGLCRPRPRVIDPVGCGRTSAVGAGELPLPPLKLRSSALD
jgi:hypothetical protein